MPLAPMSGDMPDIDIIIPVYKNLAVTRACIDSVLASDLPARTHIVVIEDASPDSDLKEYCALLAQQGRVQVIHHESNKGFVASVNEGMQLNTTHDVVLLNSDTEVVNDWLQRLQAAAYSSPKVATVTPFSNNASICSYPNFCQSNSLPTDLELAELDQVFARANAGQRLLLPTAVGFCMFIRRDALVTLGYFDTEAFGRGYGEENDFCLRASSQGWQNLLAADVFVYHHGSVSFGEDRHPLMRAAEARLALRYPEYSQLVTEFIIHDSVLPFRSAATDEIRRMALEEFLNTDKPRLLFITHSWGGGVEQHITDLLKSLQGKAHVMILRGMGRGRLEVQLAGLTRQWQSWTCGDFEGQFDQWLNALQALDFARVHLHHVHGWSPAVLKLISGLNLPFDVTLHDYYCVSRCYHLSPLAEYDRAQVQEAQAAAEDQWPTTDVEWQNQFLPLLQNAARVIAPSQDVAQRVGAVFPEVAIQVQPHPEESFASPSIIKVALLGALSPAKGLELLRRVAASALANKAPVSFRIIGHSAEPLPEKISATGSYAPHELSELIALERPDVIWLPSQVHETFGYTLSAALASGKPIVASAVGAFVERLRGIPQAQLLPADASETEWLFALTSAASQHVKPAEYSPRSLIDYSQFYNQPFVDQNPPKKLADAEALLDVLRLAPVAAPDPAKPILNLFRVGVYGGHKGAIEEVERRLARLPGGEIDVVGQLFADQLQDEQVAQSEQIHQLEDGLRQYQESFSASQQALDAAQDGLRQYCEAFEALQIEHTSTNAELHSALRRLSIVQTERDTARQRVMDIIASTSWKITRPLRLIKRLLDNAPTFSRRFFSVLRRPSAWTRILKIFRRGGARALLDRLQQEARVVTAPAPHARDEAVEQELLQIKEVVFTPLALATSEKPELTIVIPVYGQHDTTYNCLASIAANPPTRPYEIIIADDASPAPASVALAMVSGIRIKRNLENLGFLGNMNAGVEHAQGDWLVLLNNDTLVCRGALDALLCTFAEHENVGLVGAKLLNRDGTVQEAGGIIWRDGSGWNWGRNQHRDDPRFNFVREADYCSGAVLALRREVFAEMGGFDTHFAPAYYEDTDLAFRMRARNLRVLYQPAAEVYHLEGVSHGTDTNTGVKAYQQVNAVKFFERWKDVLATHRENGEQPELEAHRGSKGNILIVEACMITPDQDSGSIRMLNLLGMLKREGYHVTFVADNLEYVEKYVNQLAQIGVEVFYGEWIGNVRNLLKQVGKQLSAIFFCRHYIASQYIDEVRRYAPTAKIIFDTVDLHFVREDREAQLHNNKAILRASEETRKRELAVIEKSDVTIVVSEFEKRLLAQLMPGARVEIISNIHSNTPERPDYSAREGIIFVGGFRHPPNTDAINWYASEVLPHLQKILPGVRTRVIGSNMPEAVRALASPQLEMLGFIEDIEPYLQTARVSIAPLRYGAGVKGKVNEAMNYGIPVVATACAVEGMHLQAGLEVMVAEDPRAFAEAIAMVYKDQDLWQQLSRAGTENVQRYFSPSAALPILKRMLSVGSMELKASNV